MPIYTVRNYLLIETNLRSQYCRAKMRISVVTQKTVSPVVMVSGMERSDLQLSRVQSLVNLILGSVLSHADLN